jgi:uncharacterized protein YwqG
MAEYFTKDGDEFKKVDETLFSQTEIDTTIMPKRLERERSKFADYDTLKEKAGKVDTITSEYEEKLKGEATAKSELEKQLGSAKLETEKVKITHEFKLSNELAEFVTGDTVEDMRKRAEKLSKGFKGGGVDLDKKGKPKGTEASDSKALAGKLFGSKKSDD